MRWKFVVPAVIIVLIIALFNIFFLDGIIRRLMVLGGEKIFEAKVEVAAVKTRFSDLSVRIAGLKVADKNDVWRNLFEAGNIHFAMKPLPLLSRKFIIEDMTADGVYWGTKRTTSGALPPRKVKKAEKQKDKEDKNSLTARILKSVKQKATSEAASLPAVETFTNARKQVQNLNVESLVSAADLQSIKGMEVMRGDLQKKYSQYDAQIKSVNIDQKIKNAQSAYNDAAAIQVKGVQDIPAARDKINRLNQARNDLNQSLQQMQTLQADVNRTLGQQGDILKTVNDLKDRDISNLSAKLKLPDLSVKNISSLLFGPVWLGRVNDAVYYIHLARKFMPARKKQQVIIRPRLKGIDVSFPKENVPPDFLIRRIRLSGSTGGPGKTGTPINFQGMVRNVTSDPMLLGLPMTADIGGAQGGQVVMLKALFDHTKEVPVDSLRMSVAGLSAQDFKFPQSDFLPDFSRASVSVDSLFSLKGEALDGSFNFGINGVTPVTAAANDEAKRIVAQIWAGIDTISVAGRIAGTPDGIDSSLSSNIDGILTDRIKNVFGAELAQAQNRLKSEVDRLTSAKQNELMAEANKGRDALQAEINQRQKAVQDQLNAVQSEITKKENEIKNQATGELQKKANEGLKGLFGK